jgi:hypothetical protein
MPNAVANVAESVATAMSKMSWRLLVRPIAASKPHVTPAVRSPTTEETTYGVGLQESRLITTHFMRDMRAGSGTSPR